MAEIVNFNKAKKELEKAAAKAKAEENRAKHGQTKGFKSRLQLELEKARREFEGHKRED